MIIGLGHKLGVGKDTVGKIIQYLTSFPSSSNQDVIKYLNSKIGDWEIPKVYTIQKFADPLKDMTCIALGCTREDLESENFKNTVLGEEWNKYKLTYRTYSRIISNDVEWYEKYFSSEEEALKSIEGNLEIDESTVRIELIKMTPRLFMELLGTSCGRNIIHPKMWTNILMGKYICTHADMAPNGWDCPNWLITDVRFPEEAKSIKDRGGILIKVNRPSAETRNTTPENALNNYTEWDYEIDNSLDLNYLIDKVREILIKENLK